MFDVLKGVYRRFGQLKTSRSPLELRMTAVESLAAGQVEGLGDEMTRAGLRYHMSAIGASGVAPVQAIPSTAAQWLIYNPASNLPTAWLETLGIAMVGASNATSGAGATLYAALVAQSQLPTTVPTASAANVTIKNAQPTSQKTSSLIVVASQTLQNTAAGNWFPVAFYQTNPTTNLVYNQTMCELRGLGGSYAIPPGTGLALAILSPAGTNSPVFAPYGSWREYQGDLE